jgi:pimeloyl-ACP methyl ester carboxylesterase
LRRTLAGLLLAALAAYLGICLLLYTQQRSLLYFPQAASGRGSTLTLPAADARVLVSARELPGAEALVYFGGNAEDVSRNLPAFSAAFPRHALYLLHYRGYGGSTGEPSEAALFGDALALFDLAHARHSRVVVVGRSLGSGLAVRVASLRPAVRLVLVTPYDSIVDIAADLYPALPVRWLLRDRYESWRYAPQVRAPTLIIAAARDQVIPMQSTQRLYTRFRPGVVSMQVIAGAGHNSLSDGALYLPMFVAP